MKFSTITISALSIISAHARRRHLSIIKGEESDGSMSMAESVLYPAKGGGSSKSKSAPTPAPTPEPGQCGSIITEDFTLQDNILNCDCKAFGYALKVDGQGIVLNLNGYTVECKLVDEFPLTDHILVVGTANNILGPGTVTNGGIRSNGVSLSSGGFHTVDGVTIGPNVGSGFRITSNSNTISNNFITGASFVGIQIRGTDRNIIKDNTIIKTRLDGIILFPDDTQTEGAVDNQILDNTVLSSGLDGITILGDRNIVQGNTVDQSDQFGIWIQTLGIISEDNIVKGNSATNSGKNGITIADEAVDTVVIGNTLAGNNFNDIGGNGTVVAGNIIV